MAELSRSERINQILSDAEKNFDKFQDDLYEAVKTTKKSRDEKKTQRIVISTSDLSNDQKTRLDALNKKLKSYERIIEEGEEYLSIQNEQKACIEKLYNYNPLMDPKYFYESMCELEIPNMRDGLYSVLEDYSSVSGIKFPFSKKYMDDIYNKFMTAIVLNDTNYDENLNRYKVSIGPLFKNIMRVLGPKEKYIDYYDRTIKFMTDALKSFNNSYCKVKEEKEELKKEISKEIHNNFILEEDKKIQSLREKYNKLLQIEELAHKYDENPEQEILNQLAFLLQELDIITLRDYKYLTHDESTKDDEVEEVIEEVKEEQKEEKKPKKLNDAYYFNDKDVQTIICFLGREDKNEILEDLYDFLDKPQREVASAELVRLFNGLFNDKNFITEVGKKPASTFENRKATILLDTPYNFEYKRIGKSRDDRYRIHAISRTSDYLKKLGYGSGNIIFFGAVGINKDDKSKTEAYQRLGKRAVASISNLSGESAILTPSFDYIEHITRGYIPKELLSKEDIDILNDGKFNGKHKETNKNRSIEDGKYVLYDVVSDETKQNVKNYLNKYFLNQSNKMFEIIDDYEKNKDKSFD